MEAAVVAKGREFSSDDLAWIRAQVETREDLTRSQLSREVCERLEWCRHDGSANDMTCRSALVVLNERGLIPLPQARSSPPVAQPVEPMEPVWGRIEGALEDLGRLRIEVVTAENKELSRRWRELMAHHELGDGQLMGRQLRYLVGCAGALGWIAALAFSMPAYALAARDQWIGWSVEARKANLDRVVCNSRFLIAPWVRVRGLASKILGAMARRLPGDWAERYGVEPVLLETFIDSERYAGTCYRAANWTLVGETTGLGRLGCYEEEERRPKQIYVRALRRDFRAVLQREPLPRSPRPPRLGDAASDWAEDEIGGADFGDSRLRRRAVEVLRDFWSKPQGSIPLVSENAAKTKAAYRFMANPNVNMGEILAPHAEATVRRVSEQEVALLAQDTTSFNYTTHYANSGIGPIGSQIDGAQGLLLHDTLALTPAGLPLGVVDAQVWARDAQEFGKKKGAQVPIEAKESVKWLKSFQAAQRVQRQCPDTMIVSVGDREADVYELFAMALSKPDNPKLLVRSSHDRTLVIEPEEEGGESGGWVDPVLWDYVPSQPAAGMLRVTVPRNKKRKQPRVAELTIRFARVRLKPPEGKVRYGTLPMWAVLAHEMEPPEDEDAIQWMLLTTIEVGDVHRAIEMVQWYAARWGIEVYHKTLKSGCKIEERQLSTVPRLENCLAFDMIVAWRVMYLTMLGREAPEMPCNVVFEDYEWKSLYAFVHRDLAAVPESTPTLGEAVPLVGRLGGHLGRKHDMPAGVKSIWLGIGRLYDIGAAWQAFGPEAGTVSRRGRSG